MAGDAAATPVLTAGIRPMVAVSRGSAEAMARDFAAAFAGAAPAAILLFAADGACLPALWLKLRAAFGPDCRVLGCSSAGEFAFGGYDSGSTVAIALPAAHFTIAPVLLPELRASASLNWLLALREAAEQVPDQPGRSRFGILLIDGLSQREELVSALIDATLPGTLVLGGSAGDGLRFARTEVMLDGTNRPDSAIFCLMSTDFAVEEIVFDHIMPTPARMVVTEADPEQRLILEIDAEPAAQEYARLIGVAPGALCPAAFAENPLLVQIGGKQFVRAISGVAPGGGLRLMSSVDTGSVMTLGRAVDLTDGLEDRLARLGRPAALILGFDCILRRIALEQAGLQEDAARIFRRWNVAGFNTYGEQHGGIHVNQTFVGLAFLDPDPVSPHA
ncbi:FIST N-terminal domain-containing protein [Frigidibacter sp. MR17.24]|uniref:FIST N-terminal domain-containing protein n=1 Tax=Frigidibacter sp. MR17.24 TaxID=3127345 RepID=UPI003012AE3E